MNTFGFALAHTSAVHSLYDSPDRPRTAIKNACIHTYVLMGLYQGSLVPYAALVTVCILSLSPRDCPYIVSRKAPISSVCTF